MFQQFMMWFMQMIGPMMMGGGMGGGMNMMGQQSSRYRKHHT